MSLYNFPKYQGTMSARTGAEVKCQKCGKVFYKKGHVLRMTKRHFCSMLCFRTRKTVQCPQCGKAIVRISCRLRAHNYCSATCQMQYEYAHGRERMPSANMYTAHLKKCSGSNHRNWRGGLTPAHKKRMATAVWRKVVKQVKTRDGEACRKCGSTKRLNVHHIVPWRYTHDDGTFNLITLCASHHRALEILYDKERAQ